MAIFRRSRRDPDDAPRDPVFPFLSEDEGRVFRDRVVEAFAEQGVEVAFQDDAAVDGYGNAFGLRNLAGACHGDERGPRVWRRLARQHVSELLRAMVGPDPLEALSPEEIRAKLYVRVVDANGIDLEDFGYARPVAEELREVLAVDLPGAVMYLPERALARVGGVEELRELGLQRLRRLPVEAHQIADGPDGQRVEIVSGDSYFTASRVLVLDEVVSEVTGEPLGGDGALVALPTRHELAFHAIRGAGLVASLNLLADFAAGAYAEGAGPVSPHVHWWRAGTLTQLTDHDATGPRLVVQPDFEELLTRLAGGAG